MARNKWTASIGIDGRHGPDYAAILGLLVAWRWELVGGIMTIATMFFRELAWVLLKGNWIVNFLIVWAAVVPPALLFLVAWGLGKKAERAERHPGTG